MADFNLVRQGWLPVRRLDGSVAELSLQDAFVEAANLADLAIAFAPERVAVLRTLIAVLQSATRGPSGNAKRREWLERPAPVIDRVLAYLERWRARFELFDPALPFMQHPVDESVAATTIAALKLDWSSGNNVTLFDHHVDSRPVSLSAGDAARALLTTLHFQPSGGVSRPFRRTDSPGTKPLQVMIAGRTLWEAIAANAPRLEVRPDDAPIWERDPGDDLLPSKEGSTPRGWLERLTWRSRAVQLLPEADATVARCRIHQHLRLAEGALFDPFVPIGHDKDGNRVIVRPPAGRRLWRAADTILRGLAESDQGPPSLVRETVETFETLDPPRKPMLLAVGLQIDRAKVADAQSATLPVSRALLEDEDRLDQVTRMLEEAGEGAKALRRGLAAYHEGVGTRHEARAAERWEEPYWAALGRLFRGALTAVANEDLCSYAQGATAAWREAVRAEARAAFDVLAAQDAPDGRQARALAQGRRALGLGLSKIPTLQEDTA